MKIQLSIIASNSGDAISQQTIELNEAYQTCEELKNLVNKFNNKVSEKNKDMEESMSFDSCYLELSILTLSEKHLESQIKQYFRI